METVVFFQSSRLISQNLPKQAVLLADISLEDLQNCGIRGFIVDLDNTIVSEDDRYVSPHAESWLAEAKRRGFRCFILSNGKRRHRVEYWSRRLQIPAISPARKPFPFSFYKALAHMQISPQEAIAIGDSRHTDILGAFLLGCRCIQVASLPHPPRWWENLFGGWVQFSCPPEVLLWPLEALAEPEEISL
jgi:hypothetical protein